MRRVNGKRISLLLCCAVLILATITTIFSGQSAYAAQITNRKLTLQAGATDGGSKPGGVVNHLFNFTLPTTGNVASIKFEYCTTASGSCTVPTGLSTAAATLGNETGATGFTMVSNPAGTPAAPNGAPYLKRALGVSVTGPQAVSYRLDNVTNPNVPLTPNYSFFVRISTFATDDATGSPTDTGTVTASTSTQIELTGTMPESLIFCTGGTITAVSTIPDCSSATSGVISFNQLFSPTDTATATSQMAASTNATNGYSISVAGPTLTSGSNTIPAMVNTLVSPGTTGVRGTSQFGINLVANTTATSTIAKGSNVTPAADFPTNFRGRPLLGYNTPDAFKFVPAGENVADSAAGGAGPTNAQIYTTTYIVNVSGSQTAGTYSTTLTYVCTATF
jgi:hypothetical protein